MSTSWLNTSLLPSSFVVNTLRNRTPLHSSLPTQSMFDLSTLHRQQLSHRVVSPVSSVSSSDSSGVDDLHVDTSCEYLDPMHHSSSVCPIAPVCLRSAQHPQSSSSISTLHHTMSESIIDQQQQRQHRRQLQRQHQRQQRRHLERQQNRHQQRQEQRQVTINADVNVDAAQYSRRGINQSVHDCDGESDSKNEETHGKSFGVEKKRKRIQRSDHHDHKDDIVNISKFPSSSMQLGSLSTTSSSLFSSSLLNRSTTDNDAAPSVVASSSSSSSPLVSMFGTTRADAGNTLTSVSAAHSSIPTVAVTVARREDKSLPHRPTSKPPTSRKKKANSACIVGNVALTPSLLYHQSPTSSCQNNVASTNSKSNPSSTSTTAVRKDRVPSQLMVTTNDTQRQSKSRKTSAANGDLSGDVITVLIHAIGDVVAVGSKATKVLKRTIVGIRLDTQQRIPIAVYGMDIISSLATWVPNGVYTCTVAASAYKAVVPFVAYEEVKIQYTIVNKHIRRLVNHKIDCTLKLKLSSLFETYFVRIRDVDCTKNMYNSIRGVVASSEFRRFGDYDGAHALIVDESGFAIILSIFGDTLPKVGTVLFILSAESFTNWSDGHIELSSRNASCVISDLSNNHSLVCPSLRNYIQSSDYLSIDDAHNRSSHPRIRRSSIAAMIDDMRSRFAIMQRNVVDHRTSSVPSASSILLTAMVDLLLIDTGTRDTCYNSCSQMSKKGKDLARYCGKRVRKTGDHDANGVEIIDHADLPNGTMMHPRTSSTLRWLAHVSFRESPDTAAPIVVDCDDQYPLTFEGIISDVTGNNYFGYAPHDWMAMPTAERESTLDILRTTATTFIVTMGIAGNIINIRMPTDDEWARDDEFAASVSTSGSVSKSLFN